MRYSTLHAQVPQIQYHEMMSDFISKAIESQRLNAGGLVVLINYLGSRYLGAS